MEKSIKVVQKEKGKEIIFNRPKALNALSPDHLYTLWDSLRELSKDPPDFLSLTGKGRFFYFGADVKHLLRHPEKLEGLLTIFQGCVLSLWDFPAPTIGCLNGHASGAGLDLALACDFRIAVKSAKVSEAFVRWDLVPDGGNSPPQLIGYSRVCTLALMGDPISADNAHAWGLLHEVVEREAWGKSCSTWYERLQAIPRRSYLAIRRLLRENPNKSLPEVLKAEGQMQLSLWKERFHAP